ncbi:MAG: hypothetical protein WEB58_04840 [Planctomycetaceae bacterium]
MELRRYQTILGWVLTGSLVALGDAHAADPQAPGVARIRSEAPSAAIQQTRFSDGPVADPGIKAAETNDAAADCATSTDANGTETVEYAGEYYGRGRLGGFRGGCSHCGGAGCGFCNTTPWWFGSRQIGPLRWLLCDGYCTVSPSHGWARPYKVPVGRLPVGYTRFYADPRAVAAGAVPAPAVYPVIYTATDTTQLGYTYQHVPQWRDQPHLYPPTPWPANFHYRYCPQGRGCGPAGCGPVHRMEVVAPVEGQPPVEASVEPTAPTDKTAQNVTETF